MKYRLWDMSWKEAEEAFKKSDTVIFPVGTLHAHGPDPISIDASSVEWLANEVGKKTGMMVLPVLTYGEDEKMKLYPGSIGLEPSTVVNAYTDICRALCRNGVKKVVFLSGHGGNRELLAQAGRNVRDIGMLTAIVEWWDMTKNMPDLGPPTRYSENIELAIATVVNGKENIDVGRSGYKGEWGDPTKYINRILGDKIIPRGFNDFEYKGARITIPVDAWDVDIESPPGLKKEDLDQLYSRGQLILKRLVDYISEFVKDFEKVDVSKVFG